MADATSYSEAEGGGFAINTGNAIGAKVAAAILPIDDSDWKDVANDITGSLNGGATIAQEGATGDINAGARYTDFDGNNDVVDMGQSYTQGVGAILDNLAGEAGPAAGYILTEYDAVGSGGTMVAERDGSTDNVFQVFAGGDDTVIFRRATTNAQLLDATTAALHSFGFSLRDATQIDGYEDGALDLSPNPPAPSEVEINLSIGSRWEVYPTTANRYIGKIYLVLLFNEALSTAEHTSLHSNPWQVFNSSVDIPITVPTGPWR